MEKDKPTDLTDAPDASPGESGTENKDSPPSVEELVCHDAAVAGFVSEMDEQVAPIVIQPQIEIPQIDVPGDDAQGEVAQASQSEQTTNTESEQPEPTSSLATEPSVTPEQLTALRESLLEQILGERRLSNERIDELMTQWVRSVMASSSTLAAELHVIDGAVKQKDGEIRQKEQNEIATVGETLQRYVVAVDQLFESLPALNQKLQDAIDARSDDKLQSVAEPLRETLATYRQGLEIIQRMFARSIDRKPSLVPMDVNLGSVDLKFAEVVDETVFADAIGKLANTFHDVRDQNYHLLRDTKTDCEKQIQKAKLGLKGILSAIDGIDGGLQNERETRASANDVSQSETPVNEVVASWYGAYDGLSSALQELLERTQLSSITVEIGTPFDPETQEPQGVVRNSELNDDDVAVVLRQGFSFCGEMIRPAIVEVVKNS